MDTNINKYSVEELLKMLNVSIPASPKKVVNRINQYIQNFTKEENDVMVKFFNDMKKKILNYLDNQESDFTIGDVDEDDIDEDDDGDLFETEPRPDLVDKPVETKEVLVKKIINIDSTFRTVKNQSTSTSFTCELHEPINNVINIKLHAYHIPTTWYTFNNVMSNNFFLINGNTVFIESGTYDPTELIDELNSKSPLTSGETWQFSYDQKKHKIKIESTSHEIIFYDQNFIINESCENGGIKKTKMNNTLGWFLGFRPNLDNKIVGTTGIIADHVLNLNGPKYITLSINDFTNCYTINSIVPIKNSDPKFKMPSYYDRYSHDANCLNEESVAQLTNAQLHTINELKEAKQNNVEHFHKSEIIDNAFALINISYSSDKWNNALTDTQSSNVYERNYISPVNLERLDVKLYNDKNYILDLNGSDWSLSLIATQVVNV